MTIREWRPVSKAHPCPACGKPDWCAWSAEGYLKCERCAEPPPGMVRVRAKDGGAVFAWAEQDAPPKKKAPSARPREGGKAETQVYKSGAEALRAIAHSLERKPVKWWPYHNASGEPVGLVARFETPSGKTYRPVALTPEGWVVGAMPEPRPLYALPDLLKTKPGARVYVCEGEKSAEAARACGWCATTSAGGAKAASKTDWSPLARRDVVVLPDHDEAGEHYARDVARLCHAAGAASVRVVRLAEHWPDLPDGGDLADLVERTGGDAEALAELARDTEALVSASEPESAEHTGPVVAAYAPFPVDALPEPVRSFVRDGAAAIGSDASYIALPLLSGLAAAIGTTTRIALKRGWTEPAIIWTAIVGESGTAKSPALELALRAVRTRQSGALKSHAEAMKEHAEALAVYERDAAQWKRSKSNEPPPTKPEAPIAERTWTDDATTEALAVLLHQNPRGLLMARDELAGWFGGMDRYAAAKGGDSAKWLEMFGGRALVVDRKTGGTLHVPRAAVSIAGGIQPGILARALKQEHHESGLLARLLFAMPPCRVKGWTEADVSDHTEAAVAAVFARLYELTPEADDDGEERPRLVRLGDDGKRAWVSFFNQHAQEQAELTGDEAAAWSKLEGYAARLALVVHLTRWAADDPNLRDAERVDEASVAAGVVLARWFGAEARRVYAVLSESDDDREARRLVEWIDRKGGTVTARDLTRGPREYRRDPERAAKALGELVASGIAEWVHDDHGPEGGRPTDRIRLVSRRGDTGDGDETPPNPDESGSFVACHHVATSAHDDGWGEL